MSPTCGTELEITHAVLFIWHRSRQVIDEYKDVSDVIGAQGKVQMAASKLLGEDGPEFILSLHADVEHMQLRARYQMSDLHLVKSVDPIDVDALQAYIRALPEAEQKEFLKKSKF